MNFSYSDSTGSYPQQFYTPGMHNNQWLLQQPKDSGYASDDYDLFEKAFQTQLPSHPEVYNTPSIESRMEQTPTSAFSDSSSSEASPSSPFQYADSLCPNYNNEQWNAYESLNMSVKKLSIDAGISSMTGYCDIDSLLTAAYYDTCTTQTKRFQSFSSQHSTSARASMSIDPKSPVSLPMPTPIEDPSESPDANNRGRPRGRVPHTAVEQRYRQNLNDQFCRLRNAVPEIQTLQPARSGQPPKPSKAEVLMAAAEYIKQLEEENEQLRDAMSQALDLRRKRAKTS